MSLSKDEILAAALRVADEQGLHRLTIRALAAELGQPPMNIYSHVANKDQLLDELLDSVFAELTALPTDWPDDWVEQARLAMRDLRRVLRTHPGVVPLMITRGALGRNSMRAQDILLGILLRGGLDGATVARAANALVNYTVGVVVFETSRAIGPAAAALSEEERREQLRGFFRSLSEEDAPNAVALADHLALFSSDEQFEYGLEQHLRSLAAEARG
jgi:AcrR family transcriptional regulator